MNGSPKSAAVPQPSGPAGRERWVDDHGDFLYAMAMLRLRDPIKAQDAVQETFLAALKGESTFSGKSGERAWLTGILKHKICDHFRKAGRETSFTDIQFFQDQEGEHFIESGLHRNSWDPAHAPGDWPQPGDLADREEFWKAFHHCASKLPRNISRVFLLREVDDLSTKEICSLLEITENNLWVMLHRARMALRQCLEKNWLTK